MNITVNKQNKTIQLHEPIQIKKLRNYLTLAVDNWQSYTILSTPKDIFKTCKSSEDGV